MDTEAPLALFLILQRLHPDNELPRHGDAATTKKKRWKNWESSVLSKNASPAVVVSTSTTLTSVAAKLLFLLPPTPLPLHPTPEPKSGQPVP